MSAARLPLAYRDSCAHLLIPLNRCRYEEYYLPWKCEVWMHWSLSSYADNVNSRTKDTRTKSASMSSLRSAWPRWTSYGRQRPLPTKITIVVEAAGW